MYKFYRAYWKRNIRIYIYTTLREKITYPPSNTSAWKFSTGYKRWSTNVACTLIVADI